MSNDYYPSLARDNVRLLSGGIDRVTERGVLATDGTEYEVDAIIYGTGFKVHDALGPMSIRGRGGLELSDLWRERGLDVYMIESQVHYVLDAIETMRKRAIAVVDVKLDVQTRYNDSLQAQLDDSVWSSGCSSWYLDASGKNRTLWPGYTFRFRQATDEFREPDYELAGTP